MRCVSMKSVALMFNDMLKVSFNIVKDWHKNGPVDAAGQMIYRQGHHA